LFKTLASPHINDPGSVTAMWVGCGGVSESRRHAWVGWGCEQLLWRRISNTLLYIYLLFSDLLRSVGCKL